MRLAEEHPWGEVPSEIGGLTLKAVPLDCVTEVLAIDGADPAAALRAEVGVGIPEPGRTEAAAGVCAVWSGRGAALILGARVDVSGALCVDQSDGWAALRLGGTVRHVLARLCPLDLRDLSFPAGAAARSLLNHVAVVLARVSGEEWLLLVPRSMAGTVLEEIVAAARSVAAR